MKSFLLATLVLSTIMSGANAQSATTEALKRKHSDSQEFFFYNNTLRMINQTEDKEFDDLIKDIEKMRLLIIKKDEDNFEPDDYKQLVADYRKEAFEEIMSSRHEGKNFDVYLKEKNGKTNGMLVLINDSQTLFVLDILGSIALNKVTTLYNRLDESTDIGSKIRQFVDDDDNDKSDKNR